MTKTATVKTALGINPANGKLTFVGPQKIVDRMREVYGDSIDYVVQGQIEYEKEEESP